MSHYFASPAFEKCAEAWRARGYVELPLLRDLAMSNPLAAPLETGVLAAFRAFNGTDTALAAIGQAASRGDLTAKALLQYAVDQGVDAVPYETIPSQSFQDLRARLYESPERFFSDDIPASHYPYYSPGRTYGFKSEWIKGAATEAATRFARFRDSRRSDTAILVGNGPSLNKVDFDLFRGQDVYVSNYAIKNQTIASHARGVAVTNHLVAEQEPYWFSLNPLWKFHPLWLSYTLPPTQSTVLLNALGGPLFFSTDVTQKVAWHSTVTYFWLQILYSAGYRKVVMTGFDHFYHQDAKAKEGDLIKQTVDDQNHFDPNYFKGKNWQAADVSKMQDTYLLAKSHYEQDGREIVNATVGGHLEVFRRADLKDEIATPKVYGRIARPAPTPKIAIVTAFWKGDVDQAVAHWNLINRLGPPSADHIYLFKHDPATLKPTTLPRVAYADIDHRYPSAVQKPHPAGPNLVFVETIRQLLETDYTHFFWLEPDCIPTSSDWLAPFVQRLAQHPDEPIVGTGGGTVTPGKTHWRNHFAGCSLYSLKHLAELDWDGFIENSLDVSFDVWMSVALGYIQLGEVNNDDQSTTIIFGANRYDWTLRRKPPSLVLGMFEHWRPEKFLSPAQLEERLGWSGFSLYHAVKDKEIVDRLYRRLPKSASTIVINYNNEPFLAEAIESALAQREAEHILYEVIVVDDGSTDRSQDIIRSFGSRIKSVFLPHGQLTPNLNQQRALKAGLKVATGDVILLLDGDDIFYDDKLEKTCAVFDDASIVLAQHTMKLIDESGAFLEGVFKAFPTATVTPDLYRKLGRVNLFQPTSGLAFRRAYLSSQLHHLWADEHVETWLDVRLTRFAPYFGRIYSSDRRLGAWRRHARSDSIRKDNVAERVRKHEQWFDAACHRAGLPAVPFSWRTPSAASDLGAALIGPFSRDEHAHLDETRAVRALLHGKKSGFMIDVGAHEGHSLKLFLDDAWDVIAFEPDDVNRGKLTQLLAQHRNGHRVEVDTRCVSDRIQSKIPFFRSPQSTGISGLSAFHETHAQAQSVDTVTLGAYLERRPLGEVDFLKIDTEGHDLFVLKGFPWERQRPAVIECEFEDRKTVPLGYTYHDLARFLTERGYTVYVSEWHPIVRYGIRHEWRRLMRYPADLADEASWGNLVAFRDPVDERPLAAAFKSVMRVENKAKPVATAAPAAPVAPIARATAAAARTRWLWKPSTEATWKASAPVTGDAKGTSFIGGVRISSSKPITVVVKLSGGEGGKDKPTTQQVTLRAHQPQVVALSHRPSVACASLSLSVQAAKPAESTDASLTLDCLYFVPSLSELTRGVRLEPESFRKANARLRAGDLLGALATYVLLHKKNELGIYQSNAMLAARRLGMPPVSSMAALSKLMLP